MIADIRSLALISNQVFRQMIVVAMLISMILILLIIVAVISSKYVPSHLVILFTIGVGLIAINGSLLYHYMLNRNKKVESRGSNIVFGVPPSGYFNGGYKPPVSKLEQIRDIDKWADTN